MRVGLFALVLVVTTLSACTSPAPTPTAAPSLTAVPAPVESVSATPDSPPPTCAAAVESLAGSLLECSFAALVTGGSVSYNVYLPPGYDAATDRYPVVYHLHGIGGSQGGNQNVIVPATFETALDAGVLGPVIVVFPNGADNSMWSDSKSGSKPVETTLMAELLPHIDSHYRTVGTAESRVLEGFSMGGFGVAHLMTKYPGVFGTFIVYDGALLDWTSLNMRNADVASEIFEGDETYFDQFSPWTLLAGNPEALEGASLRMVVGALTDYNRRFHDAVTAQGIPVDYTETSCGHNLKCLLDAVGADSARFIADHVATAP